MARISNRAQKQNARIALHMFAMTQGPSNVSWNLKIISYRKLIRYQFDWIERG